MAIDDFVMVIPPGWVEIQGATSMIETWGEDGMIDIIQRESWGDVDSMLEAAGVLPSGQTVAQARLFNTGGHNGERLRLWVRYITIPPNPT